MYSVWDARPQDLLYIAENMRKCDADEIAATSGVTPHQAMCMAAFFSPYRKCGGLDENPCLIFGVCPTEDEQVGKVWMLATDILTNPKARHILARHSREWVEDMQSLYPVLTNITDARNTIHHRWLKWCGFVFLQELKHGPVGAPFYEFVRIRGNV